MDKVEFYINDTDYTGQLISYRIRWSIFDGAGTMDAEVNPIGEWQPRYRGKDKFLFIIGGKMMLRGYIDSWNRAWSKGNHSLRITGRDALSILEDSCFLDPVPYPKPTAPGRKWKIEDVVKDVFDNMPSVKEKEIASVIFTKQNLDVLTYNFTSSAKTTLKDLPALSEVKISAGDTIFGFLSKIINAAGLFMYVEPGTTDIIIQSFYVPFDPYENDNSTNYGYNGEIGEDIRKPYPVTHRRDGLGNVISLSLYNNRNRFFTYVKVLGSGNVEGSVIQDENHNIRIDSALKQELWGISIEEKDIVQHRFSVLTVNDVDEMFWKKSPERLTNNIGFIQARNVLQWNYTVPYHSLENTNEPYFIERTAMLWDDYLIEQDGDTRTLECLVSAVEYVGGKTEGQTTTMSLIPKSFIDGFVNATAFARAVR
jgi:prophage tail gpP-like protein